MIAKESEELLDAARPLIELAIAEDIGPGDATSNSTLSSDTVLHGRIVAKESGVIAGIPIAVALFQEVDPGITVFAHVADGQEVVAGELIAEVSGPGPSLLAAERTALNFLQRLSGIATQTRNFVDAVAVTRASILDTRKTIPGYRVLEKYAVRMGGGVNHRMSLFDMMMIKDNHIDGVGGIKPAVDQARAKHPNLPIEVEVRGFPELHEALDVQPPLDRILLDNMDLNTMREAVTLTDGRVPLEASGNVTLETVSNIAATGVDCISVGSLTHSAEALDLSMKVGPPRQTEVGIRAQIEEIKATLGDRLVILGHHYQRDEVIEFADLRGDSLKLSRDATETESEFIVFCGVHFMAQVATILARPGQHVLIPDVTAGCYLADTAAPDSVQCAWDALARALGGADAQFTPITYVNSSAELKAFCGRHGGLVCTSGNAQQILSRALAQRPRVFFFPDQHLGRNTARQMGIHPDEILLWEPILPPSDRQIRQAKIVLWRGACNVHQRFRPEHVHNVRAQHPDIRVIVHPECDSRVVELADDAGSTARIIDQIRAAPAGTKWAVGTESRLVQRLARQHRDQTIISLSNIPPFCATMGQITSRNLLQVLEALSRGEIVNAITVDPETARWARVALERMLAQE